MAREEVKTKEKGGGFTWRRLSHQPVANGGAVVPAVPAMLVAAPPLFFPFPFSLFFSSFFLFGSSFFLFFGLITLSLCSLSLLFSFVLSYVFSAPLSLVLSPVFIGKTGGREVGGGHCAAASKTARGTHLLPLLLQHVESFGQVGLVDVFLRESWRWKTEEEKKIFLFPCFARLGEEEDI